ncbi:hypothetical protein GCM10027321_15070 [Massilia terrae]|uniref:histidine kinase n=1 Tax=Massilia terrae TaxID=1811224 RepID=A0ABT2D3I0_9BURK|nr:ATP-binding protein [Massilia terrae]MCS0659888.1 ATP-binding protein [Massilia terrae]
MAAFRAIAELAGDTAFIIDCRDRALTYLSAGAGQLLGYGEQELSQQLLNPDADGPLAALCAGMDARLRRFADGDRSRLHVIRDIELTRPDGSSIPLQLSSTLVLDQAGTAVALAGVIRDRSAERAIQAEQQRFARMLNHEFRTPLAVIDGAIQRLEATSAMADEAVRQRYRKIGSAVDRLIGMLDEYLSPERMAELGRARAPNGVDPRILLEEAADQARAAGRPVKLDLDGLPPSLRGDPQGLRLALKVLVDNALAFSPPGSGVELTGRGVANGIDIRVRDHGAGVPPGESLRIFDKTFRGSNAVGLPGSGLGLYMARAVLEVHGGTLELLDQQGDGAMFKIWLPTQINRGKVVA